MNDDLIGAFEELPYPFWRILGEDTVRLGKARHHVLVLLEVDVTAAIAALASRKQRSEPDVSFTAWAVKCIAQAAAEHKRVHAVRRGRRGLVTFSDVDMTLAVYRRLTGDESGERLPMPFVLRKVNEKSLQQVGDEIRIAQSRALPPGEQWMNPHAAMRRCRRPPPKPCRFSRS